MRLKEKVDKLEQELHEKSKIIEFLCNYDKDDVVITQESEYTYATIFNINPNPKKTIVYLYGGKLQEVDVNYLAHRKLKVLKNMETEALIGITTLNGYKPLLLNKATGQLTEISDEVCEELLKIADEKKESFSIGNSNIKTGFMSIGD